MLLKKFYCIMIQIILIFFLVIFHIFTNMTNFENIIITNQNKYQLYIYEIVFLNIENKFIVFFD